MAWFDRLVKATNHGTNYLFGRRPGAGTPASPGMPPSGSDHPPANRPTPNESVIHGWGTTQGTIGQMQDNKPQSNYGITGEQNEGTGPGPSAGTDINTPEQNVAQREGIQPIQNPPGISVVSSTDWFGPLQPLRPAAPMGTGARKFEYVLGQNIIFEPRANEAISFRVMRALADSTDLLRAVIETVKNQMKRSKWDIHSQPLPGEEARAQAKRESQDKQLLELRELLRHPDGLHPWETFCGELMEDMLVVDAPSVLIRRDPSGKKVKSLVVVDGSRITRYITTSGLTPESDPECTHEGHALLGRMQEQKAGKKFVACNCAAYTQYLYGVNAVNLTTHDLVYIPYNMRPHKLYGYSPVEQIIVAINLYLRREMALLEYYTSGNIPEMIAFLPNSVTVDQVKEFEEWFNTVNRGDQAFMRRVRFLQNPSASGEPKIFETKQHLLAEELDNWLARIICYAFNVPPNALVKMGYARAMAQTVEDESQATGIESYQTWFASFMNHIIHVQMGMPQYTFAFLPIRETDLLAQRQADSLLASKGGMTWNEWRLSEGRPPYGDEFPDADRPIIITAAGYVVIGDGGPVQQKPLALPTPPGADGKDQENGKDEEDDSPPDGKKAVSFPIQAARVNGTEPHAAFGRIRQAVLETFREQADALKKALGELRKNEQQDLEKKLWLAIAAYYALLPDRIEPGLKQAAIEAAMLAAQQAGAPPGIQSAISAFTRAKDYARSRAAELVGRVRAADGTLADNPNARWVISETTRQDIREAVEKALAGELKDAEGKPLDLSEAIRRQLLDTHSGPFSEYRANLIARTEIKNAQAAAKNETWKRMGVPASTWWTMHDSKVCPFCAMNDGVTVPLGKPFPSGAKSVADSHPNCRCLQLPANLEGMPGARRLSKSTLGLPQTWHAYFGRHEETIANEHDLARGWGNWGLTPDGRKGAQRTAEWLVGHGITRIVSSDLPRAKQTAEIYGKALDLPVELAPELRSLNVGEFTGSHKPSSRERFLYYIKHTHRVIPGGESVRSFVHRIAAFVVRDMAEHPDDDTLYVTHSSGLGALWEAINGADWKHLAHDDIVEPGGVAELAHGDMKAIYRPAPQRSGELIEALR